jgi:probable rRNA maturation factor
MIYISKTVKENPPVQAAFFLKAKNLILGKTYELNVIFIGTHTSKTLNSKYRGIDKPTDILSFELEKRQGEIYINPKEAKRKSKLFKKKYSDYLKFLFIHGLCHLKGMDHGSRMDNQEKKYSKLLGLQLD